MPQRYPLLEQTSCLLAYEHSKWLDFSDRSVQVEGDPNTIEEFTASYDFLHLVTVYFTKYYGAVNLSRRGGLWWTATAEDIKEELNHYNAWAIWDAQQGQRNNEAITTLEIQLKHVHSLSYRRLQALKEAGELKQPEYPLFLHLHEKIREARLKEAQINQLLSTPALEPNQPITPFLITPAWKLLYEIQRYYSVDDNIQILTYGTEEKASYGFEAIDPYKPHRAETEYEHELHLFPDAEQALAVQYEYINMGYKVSDLKDYRNNVILASQVT